MISCQVFLDDRFSLSRLRLVNVLKDLSTNGFTLNGYEVRRSSVLLMDGDIMELPFSRSGYYLLRWTPESAADPPIARIQVHTSKDTVQREGFHL
jgi:hypothetical protein